MCPSSQRACSCLYCAEHDYWRQKCTPATIGWFPYIRMLQPRSLTQIAVAGSVNEAAPSHRALPRHPSVVFARNRRLQMRQLSKESFRAYITL